MKIGIALVFASFIISQKTVGQSTSLSLKIFAVSWESKYNLKRTVDNIKTHYIYSFETTENDLANMFLDYNDGVSKLGGGKPLLENDSLKTKKSVNALMELNFSKNKVINICFDNKGNYYFNGKWYQLNPGLYYHSMKYFSNEIVPEKTLNEAKEKTKDELWH